MYTAPSLISTAAWPPGTRSQLPPKNSIFSSGSYGREFTRSVLWPASSERSAMCAARSAIRANR
jgi:hypothetical protein